MPPLPPMPELERVLPPHPEDWKFDLRIPEFYDHYWRKHDNPEREKFLEMLPFYNLFKKLNY
jgi:hypothetical protein